MRFISWILGFTALFWARAEEPLSPFIRVAVLRDAARLDDALSRLCSQEYHGTIRVIKDKQKSYTAVNILDVEDFLLGVVGREMDPKAPLEALKAQAVAARSHALYQASISKGQPYDLVANLSQAYGGKSRLHKNVVISIEATRGEVLCYRGRPIPAYFHASCGGRTETIPSVWQLIRNASDEMNAGFPAAARCPSCSRSSENKWSFEVSAATLLRVLGQAGYKAIAPRSIRIVDKAAGGHSLTVAIAEEKGGEVRLPAEKLRSLLGYSNLRSTLFEVRREQLPDGTPGDRFLFEGVGYGHGVGLCQFGACEMAESGSSYDRILAHYFPKCHIAPYTMKLASAW